MADRTMEELLQAPTEGRENDNPHTHISNFKRMTATLKYRDVLNDAIKLMLFPYSLEDRARIWACPHHGFSELTQIDTFYNGLTEQNQDSLNFASGVPNNQIPPSVSNEFSSYIKSNEIAIKTMQNQINVLRGDFSKQEENLRRNLKDDMRSILGSFFQNQPSTSGTLPSNTIPNPKDEQNTEEILDKEHSNSSGSTAQVQPPVVPILIPEPNVLRTQSKPSIPYPSRVNDQKLREKATNQMEKFFQIFHDLHFDISFADALLLVPKFASTIKNLLANKDKLFELANVSLNEKCSAMLMKKLSEKLGDPGKFLIPCDFLGMEVCHALSDLGASINLMPLSIWEKLSLPELTLTQMTLELADRSITHPNGVAEDVFVKVGKFHFPTDFIVIDFEADPRVPLILGRSFLRTGRALIDVYGEEITLKVNNESITYSLSQTMRYSSTYDYTLVNRVDVIDVACKDFVQDVLDFQYNPKSSSPTLVYYDLISESNTCKVPIVKSSSPTLNPFGESDFFLEEIEDFLNDDSILIEIENSMFDSEGDILLIEKFLNEDPCQLPLMDLKVAEESKEKSFVEEPHELELKELPSHLEHAFLEDSNKLPDNYQPAVQSQRRVNPKIYDVIKKEVIKLLDAGMIYPISDSPWVSLIHCVPKKGGMTVVANENNELIPTRLVTGWRTNDSSPRKGDTFVFSKECIDAFNTLKKKLIEASILVVPDWNFPFELICDASDYAIGAVLGQHKSKHFQPIHYESKTMIEAQIHYTTTEKEMLAVVYAFEKFRPYIVLSQEHSLHRSLCFEIFASQTGCKAKIIRRCVHGQEAFEILKAFHEGPSEGHHGVNLTAKKRQGKISQRDEMPQNKRKVGENRTSWSDKLDDALWAFHAAYKTPIGCTPYRLVYGKSCHLPIELEHRAYWALKHVNFNLKTAGDHRKLQLNKLSELRDQAYENSVIYKERTKKLYDSKIKNRIFNVDDQVLLFNSRQKIFSGS
nr:reverse transcriptase domain-containing protein [Tanacetum cinerariifolium]